MASRSDRSIFGKEPPIAVDSRVFPTSDQGDNKMRKYLGLLENKTRPFITPSTSAAALRLSQYSNTNSFIQ